MNKSGFFSKALPHIIAGVIFLAISIFMYRPIVFEGKIMYQNDMNQGKGATSEVNEYRNESGEEAIWTNSMFSGMPTYLTGLRWSGGTVIRTIQNTVSLYMPAPVGENFMAFAFFYIMLLCFGVRPYLAMGGALAFGLSTFYVISIQAGHMWKIRAIAYIPLVIAGVQLVFTRRYLLGFIITALGVALEINANHLQITYYLFILLMVYGLSELVFAIREEKLAELSKKVAILIVAAVLAVGTNFGKLWSTYEYGKISIRGKSELSSTPAESKAGLDREYAFRWSSGKWESMTLFIPHLYGGGSGIYNGKDSEVGELLQRNNVPRSEISQIERAYLGYWGKQPGTAGPAYVGAVFIFLFILSLFFLEGRHKYWMLSIVILSIMLSWGKNFPSFNNFMFDVFPGYNKFRAVTMVITLALTIIPLMGMMGLQKLIQLGLEKENQKKLFIAGATSIGVALFAWMVTDPPAVEGVQNVIADAIEKDRESIIKADVLRSVFYVAACFGLIYFLLKKKITFNIFAAIFIALVVLDLGLVDSRYLNSKVFVKPEENTYLDKTPADERILEDESLGYRVLNLQDPFNEARTSRYHHSIGGYHGAKIRRYQDVISKYIGAEMQQIIQDQGINKGNSGVISMLNAKYLLAGTQANGVIPNPHVNGDSWFVDEVRLVNNPDEEISTIGEVDLSNTAVIDKSKFDVGNVSVDSVAYIRMTEYSPNHLKYEAETNASSLAVFSEVYYPVGWKAFIDGEETEILRANYLLRALEIKPGKHTIEFVFEPRSYFVGNWIMMISSIVLLLVIILGIVQLWRNKPTAVEEQ